MKLALVLSFIGTVFCHEEFQCQFDSKSLHVPTDGGKYVWGKAKAEVEPIKFKNNNELLDFLDKVDGARENFYLHNIYNDFDSYVSETGELAKLQESDDKLDKFIENYIPPLTTYDNIGLLIRFLRSLGRKLRKPNLHKSYYIALKGVELTPGEIRELRDAGTELPFDQFQYESLVGIIKIEVDGVSGYAVINIDQPDNIIPYVMENSKVTSQESTKSNANNTSYILYVSNGSPISYEITGTDESFVENVRMTKINTQTISAWLPDIFDVIYLRPLCSFIQVQNRVNIKTTHTRSIIKYSQNFKILSYVFARTRTVSHTDPTNKLFTVAITDEPTDVEYLTNKIKENNGAFENGPINKKSKVEPAKTVRSVDFNSIDELSKDDLNLLEDVSILTNVNIKSLVTDLRAVLLKNTRS